MSGASSRRKGHSYERELVHVFRTAFPGADVKRGFQSRSGRDAPDVDCPLLWVEAKRGKKPNPRSALAQAQAATDGRIPCAVVRDDRMPAFVVIGLSDFVALVREAWQTEREET